MWDAGMTGDGIGMTGEASLFAERRGVREMLTVQRLAGHPLRSRSARSRPLTQAKGAYHPSPMDSRLRGNDVCGTRE